MLFRSQGGWEMGIVRYQDEFEIIAEAGEEDWQ